MNVTYLVMENTIDEPLREVIDGKRKVASDLSQPVMAEVLAKWGCTLQRDADRKPEKKVSRGIGL